MKALPGVVLVDIKYFYYYGYRGKKFELTFYGIELLDVLFFSDAQNQRQQAKVTCHAN